MNVVLGGVVRRGIAATIAAVLALVAGSAAGESSDGGILTLQFENDMFGSADRHFTHGTRVAWMSAEDDVPGWAKEAASYFPLFDAAASKRITYSFGQSIFTPDDIRSRDLLVDERPYAGWLYGEIGMVSVSGDRLDNLSLQLGVVGPASLAKDVQRAWHRWFGLARPEGWHNQLRNEPGVVLTYERKWRRWSSFPLFGLDGDVTPHLGGSVGNVMTHAAAGFMLRIGDDLGSHYDYGPPRIRPSPPGSDYFIPRDSIGWYLFAGIEGRAVARNIFLDGNTFRDSHSVDKKILVGDAQAGLAVIIGRARLSYTHIWRSKEFGRQDGFDQFGSVSLSVQF